MNRCPHCGKCPHCGQGAAPAPYTPIYPGTNPYPYPMPWTQPFAPPAPYYVGDIPGLTITCGTVQ